MSFELTLRVAAAATLLLTFMPWPAQGQSVDEIVDRHIAARGGLQRLKAIETLRVTRTVATGIGTTLKVIVYRKRPQLFRVEQGPAQSSGPLTPRVVNAEVAWDTQGGKVVTRPPEAFAEARDIDADFDGLLVDWKDKGHSVTYLGLESLPGGDAHKLSVTTRSGAVRTVYLDARTYLDRRHTGVLTLGGGRKFDVTIDFGNWQEIAGVKFPFDITEERTGGGPVQSLVTYTEKIEANVPLDEALFATPAAQDPSF